MQEWLQNLAKSDLLPQIEPILSLVPIAVAVIEMPSQRYIFANANYCRALRARLEPQALIGKTVPEILGAPNSQAMEALSRAHLNNEATKFDTLVSHSVGADTTYWTGAAIPISRNGQRTWVLGLLAEVTQRVRAQQEAERKQRELEIEKERTVEFMAMAVHELRTPLTCLKMLTQLLLEQSEEAASPAAELPTNHLNTLQTIDQQSARLVRLINDLLNSVRSSTGQLDLRLENVSVTTLLAEFLQEAPSMFNGKKIDFQNELGASPVLIKADRERLRQVVLNLIHNALIHSETQAPILLRTSTSDTHMRLEVIDLGKGIPVEDLEKIFDRFYRRHAEKRVSGLGLGLYLSRRLIEAMGGRIWAQSEGAGRGSKFTVELPRVALQ